MDLPKRIELFFKVRKPAYNLIKWLNHEGKHSKDRETLQSLIDTFSTVPSFKRWLKKRSAPKDCCVDENDKELFDAFANYFVSFFKTSLGTKKVVYCDSCNIEDYRIGPKRLTKKAKNEAKQLIAATLEHIVKENNTEISQEVMQRALREDFEAVEELNLVTYVREASRRVEFTGAGAAVHALWKRLTKKQKKELSSYEYEKSYLQVLKALLRVALEYEQSLDRGLLTGQ
ncbi:hypothetical protein GF342_04500 [Candidatus Woesearchaeota archaeon]|nr:hypothetical protein [Candidatus Woesearchaeota archaeon]